MNPAFTLRNLVTMPVLRHDLWGVFILLISSLCQAGEPPNLNQSRIIVPEQITGAETLSAEDVIALAMEKPDLIIVDARIANDRKHGYLENSQSLPDIETSCNSLAAIIPSKNSPVMFYCNGIQCGRSVVSIKIARSCGYSTLYWFKGGFEEWKMKGYQYSKNR